MWWAVTAQSWRMCSDGHCLGAAWLQPVLLILIPLIPVCLLCTAPGQRDSVPCPTEQLQDLCPCPHSPFDRIKQQVYHWGEVCAQVTTHTQLPLPEGNWPLPKNPSLLYSSLEVAELLKAGALLVKSSSVLSSSHLPHVSPAAS